MKGKEKDEKVFLSPYNDGTNWEQLHDLQVYRELSWSEIDKLETKLGELENTVAEQAGRLKILEQLVMAKLGAKTKKEKSQDTEEALLNDVVKAVVRDNRKGLPVPLRNVAGRFSVRAKALGLTFTDVVDKLEVTNKLEIYADEATKRKRFVYAKEVIETDNFALLPKSHGNISASQLMGGLQAMNDKMDQALKKAEEYQELLLEAKNLGVTQDTDPYSDLMQD